MVWARLYMPMFVGTLLSFATFADMTTIGSLLEQTSYKIML